MTAATGAATLPGLHPSAPHPLPFAPDLHIRAFALERDADHVLLYSTPGLDPDAAPLRELGGVTRHLLNHRHEASFAPARPLAPLFVHEREREAVARHLPVRATFSRRHVLDGDLEVIPTPGHTSGATAYLWDSGEHRMLFTGDTVLLHEGEWIGAVLPSSDRAAYLESLELLRGLEFDVLVPWAASASGEPVARTDPADARRRLGALLDRVRRGEDR